MCLMTATAALDSGTRCSRPPFIRLAGIVHTFARRSSSSHLAPSTSPCLAAVKIVNSIPAGRPILFLPDVNLGNYVQRQTGRQNMRIWQGACIVHATFPARRLAEAKLEHPEALVVAHPECPEPVLAMADYVGSTSALIEYCAASPAREFIVLTESGVHYSLARTSPDKRFYYVANENCNCSECPYMKLNTLEKLRDALVSLEPRVELSAEIMERALVPLERMLAVR